MLLLGFLIAVIGFAMVAGLELTDRITKCYKNLMVKKFMAKITVFEN